MAGPDRLALAAHAALPWHAVCDQARRWMAVGCFEAVVDSRTIPSTPESGARAGYDGYKRRNGSKAHIAVDTMGRLLALHVTPADEQDRAQVARLCEAIHEATSELVELIYADRGSSCTW